MDKQWIKVIKVVSGFIILQQLAFLLIFVPGLPAYLSKSTWTFALLYILLGMGTFVLKSMARRLLVIFQIFIIAWKMSFAFFNFYPLTFGRGLPPATFLAGLRIFLVGLKCPYYSGLISYIPILLNLFYLYFFTHPEVKEQF